MRNNVRMWSTALLACGTMVLVGCGGNRGGADTETTVTLKPSTSAGGTASGGSGDNGGAASVAEGFGTFKGRVRFQGTVPSLAVKVSQGAAIKDADICAAVDVPDESLVVNSDGGVANVFVYLQKVPKGAKKTEPSEEPVIFDQKGCRFIPHALVVRVGQPVRVVSGDQIAHNTHTLPTRNSESNNIVERGSRTGFMVNYTKTENVPFRVICDFHSWMLAYHLALDHPFGAVTDANGEFEIPDLPAGEHKFVVWHEGSGFLTRNLKITITADQTTEQKIDYPLEKFGVAP